MNSVPEERADEVLERLRANQDIIYDFSQIAATSTDFSRLLKVACVQVTRAIGIERAKVMRHRPEHGDLLIEAGVGWRPGVVGRVTLGIDVASPPGRTLQTRQPVIIEDVPGNADFRYSPVLRQHGIVSLINVPVVAGGVTWGVLEVDSAKPRRFGRDDEVFLLIMATILGGAIQRHLETQEAVEASAQAARALAQQKTLMRELVHRDKNDFQRIISLMMLEQRLHQSSELQQSFRHIIDRVTAISMAHDQLRMREGYVDVASYLQALCGNLSHRRDGVSITTELDTATLSYERVVPLGLIVNELVTNAIKYAFPDGRGGTIKVTFRADAEASKGCLCVADDGVGMTEPRPVGLGLRLIESLARQIEGHVTSKSSDQGTTFQVDFLLVG